MRDGCSIWFGVGSWTSDRAKGVVMFLKLLVALFFYVGSLQIAIAADENPIAIKECIVSAELGQKIFLEGEFITRLKQDSPVIQGDTFLIRYKKRCYYCILTGRNGSTGQIVGSTIPPFVDCIDLTASFDSCDISYDRGN